MRVERNASVHTLRAYRIDLMDFARWACRERIDILAATHRQLRRYLGELDRAQYSRTTVNRRLSALRSFFRWLNVTGIADEDPASILQGPKQPKSLPHVIRASDMVKLLTVYGKRDAAGREREQSSVDARNLALLEFLYDAAPACRGAPVCLRPTWISERAVKVFGNGSKERIVPLHDMAVSSMRAYATWARPLILRDRTCDYFFVSTRGNRMGTDAIRKMFKDALRQAGLDESLSPHDMRHTFATDLLDGAPTCAASRRCWDMPACPPRRSTPIFPPAASSRCTPAPTPEDRAPCRTTRPFDTLSVPWCALFPVPGRLRSCDRFLTVAARRAAFPPVPPQSGAFVVHARDVRVAHRP